MDSNLPNLAGARFVKSGRSWIWPDLWTQIRPEPEPDLRINIKQQGARMSQIITRMGHSTLSTINIKW